ncbi:unnamed protein product [Diabrotica balteata]|uniref:Carboxylesterase type B domain-containing protein n=1 Tax=Diabrotica balteata TaxID=107213 RepID=A0A9P0DXU6_DIABA|nr:unnamed protein product [Diabrotica balteata]
MAPIVQLAEGKISGGTRTDLNGEKFHSFLCIPYGKAPIGELRFKAPLPVEPWEGVKEVITEDKIAFQKNILLNTYIGQEDCLSLHVFTRKLPSEETKLKPVMVFIHGGGFVQGSHETTTYGPEHLMTEDIVLVTITYRLGLLGFLSLKDESLDVPGNAGLKDQVLALKWIQRNIKNFNGDSNNVTIFGESAGGASVEYLLLSPSTKGLFHKAIVQSGSTLNPWALTNFPLTEFAKFHGKASMTEKELLKSLRDAPVQEVYDQQLNFVKLITDAVFAAGIQISAKNQAKVSKNPVYFYRFTLNGGLNLMKKMINDQRPGACHADEMGYLFKTALATDLKDEDKTSIKQLVTLWTNFAKFCNPTPSENNLNIEWKPIQNGQFNFLDIGKQLKMDVNPDLDRMNIWDDIYQCISNK